MTDDGVEAIGNAGEDDADDVDESADGDEDDAADDVPFY